MRRGPAHRRTRLFWIAIGFWPVVSVMPDDHSEVVPLLPIPNRTVKRLCADDSAGSRVKVGHRQAINRKPPSETTEAFSLALTV